MINRLIILIVLIVGAFFCKKDEPCLTCPPPAHTVSLDTVLVDPTEVWLKLSTTDITTFADTIRIIRDDTVTVFNARLLAADTVVTNTRLLPGHLYQYRASRLQHSTAVDFTAPLLVRTMDTSSHSFRWQIDTLGEFGGDGLHDVAIINDTCIWAVGDVFLRDSTGQLETDLYNLAVWDGQGWHLERVPVPVCGTSSTGSFPLFAIFAFDGNDVWVSGGADIERWDGHTWRIDCSMNPLVNGAITNLWGISPTSMYGVGRNGTIVYFDGNVWQKVASGTTTLDVVDIYGSINPRSGQQEILAVASKSYQNYERKILRIDGTTVTEVSDSGIGTSITGVWFAPGRRYYVSGDGIFTTRTINGASTVWKETAGGNVAPYFKQAIRGNSINDIVAAGDLGTFVHFDGVRWRSFLPETYLSNGHYEAVAIKGNLVVAVGYNAGHGVVAIGKR